MTKADAARHVAYDALFRFQKRGTERLKADNLIQEAVARLPEALSEQDRAFVYALVMGTLRHWLRLDEWLKQLTGRPLKQVTPQVRVLLRMGLFQLYGLSQVPAYAAINTTVELAKAQKASPKTIKFINAVLREAQRRLDANSFEAPSADTDLPGHLLRIHGWPEELTRQLLAQHKPNDILAMAQVSEMQTPLAIRVNTLKTSPEAYREMLIEAGFTPNVPDETVPEGLQIIGLSGSPRQLPGYDEGLFYVQDPSSMWVAHFLEPQPQQTVLDLCAAPGSKTTHLAALMQNQGQITAIEPKKERLAFLNENIERLGVTTVAVRHEDGLSFSCEEALFDSVLVDAPCSGSGTIRKHPEILLHLRQLNLTDYVRLQSALLEKGFACLKPGGTLVYSTCSILRAENHEVVAKLLAQHKAAVLEAEEQRVINENADGFYAARIRKKG